MKGTSRILFPSPQRCIASLVAEQMLAAACASIQACSLLHTSTAKLQRASLRGIWVSRAFKAVHMSKEEPIFPSSSASGKLCGKAIEKSTHEIGDIEMKNKAKDGISVTQCNVEYEDMKKPSPEVRQGSSNVGIEDSLVVLKDDDSLTKLTVAELRAMLRRNGIQPTGRKQDLILALKKISRNESAVQNSGNGLPKEAEDCLPHINPDQVTRKTRHKSSIKLSVKDSQSLVQCVADTADKLQISGKNSSKSKKQSNERKRSADVIAQSSGCEKETESAKAPLTKNENKDCEESMIESTAPDKVLAQKKRKTSKVIENSNMMEVNTFGENEPVSNFQQPWTMLVHKKVQPGWVAYNPAIMRPSSPLENANIIKMISWNVNGLRALLKRKDENSFLQLAKKENFDVLCLQETKLQEKDVEQIKQSLLDGYDNSFWTCSVSKLGYAGTAVISRIKPVSVKFGLGIPDHDGEGRLITIELDTVYLVAGYVPNSGQKLERLSYRVQQWDPFLSSYLKDLEKKKPVVFTGDLNCAHEEIDIYNPDGNRKSAGFTDEERMSFEDNFLNRGFVDSFRQQHPKAVGYTYWGYRQGARPGNKGWRLDYFLVSDSIADKVYDSYIIPDVNGSDHCPIGLILKW